MKDRNVTNANNFADYIVKSIGYLTCFVLLWIFFISKFLVIKEDSHFLNAKFVKTYFHKHRRGHSMGVTVLVDGETHDIGYESTDLSWALEGRNGEPLRFYLYNDYTYFTPRVHTWKVETMDGEVIYEN